MNEMTNTPVARTALGRSLFGESGLMGRLHGEIDRLFDEFAHPARGLFDFPSRHAGPVPAIELSDGGKQYHLTVELPGLDQKDVDVDLTDGVLTVSGEKGETSDRQKDGYMISERRYGAFQRRVTLPSDADADAIRATFKNGVLALTIGKDEKAAARSRKIAIGT